MKFGRLFSALEDVSEDLPTKEEVSVNKNETEITIYAKISNLEGLKESKGSEEQIQVEAQLGQDHHCRVRKTTVNGQDKYVYTFKVQQEGANSDLDARREHNVDVDEGFFNDFILTADKLQDKVRYFFEAENITLMHPEGDHNKEIVVPGVVYEVDVFKKPDGTVSEWCKIDIEIDKILVFMEHNYPDLKDLKLTIRISQLPIKPINGLLNDKSNSTVRSFIQHLYDVDFCRDLVEERKEKAKNE